MYAWPPISRDDLREAADRAGFDMVLPLLVRRLVAETGDGLTELEMPGGSGVAAGGFDGIVTAAGCTIEVPDGTSVWELSVNDNAGAKADEDFGKRVAGPEGRPAASVTYVQLILAVWTKARDWAADRRAEGRWKDVRALNLDAVHAWLDRAPATTAWLAGQLRKGLPSVRSADDWMERTWSPSTRIALGPAIVLAGRDGAASGLLTALERGQVHITVAGELTVDEFHAFVAAAQARAEAPHRDGLTSRTLLVGSAEILLQLVAQPHPLVLVLADARLTAQLPADHAHQLVVRVPRGSRADVVVEPVDAETIRPLLQAAGEPWDRAGRLAALARRSVPALRRTLALQPASLRPSWADEPSTLRRRVFLVGSWHGTGLSDRAVVEEICARSYTEVEEVALDDFLADDVPMIGLHDDHWHVLAVDDAWMLLAGRFTESDLTAFCSAAVAVLTEQDPLVGMNGMERLAAERSGVCRPHSAALRKGLATTLAVMGTADPSSMSRARELARRTVRSVLHSANSEGTYALWAGLRDVVGLLAEAAPEDFLEAMRDGLQGEDPLHAGMFTDPVEEHLLFAAPPLHTEVLRALELLAWSPDLVDEVIEVLALLAIFDPGGRYANRPFRSLADILSCWRPATTAGADQRLEALRQILRAHPDLGRRLLVALVPSGHDTQFSHPTPRFGPAVSEPHLTQVEVLANVDSIAQLLIDDLQEVPERFVALLGKVDHLPSDARDRFLDSLTALGDALDDDAARGPVYDAVLDVTTHHREYADAWWALPAAVLHRLEQAADGLRPARARRAVARLFVNDWISLGDVARHDDLEAYDTAKSERRADAVGRVLEDEGLDGVAALTAGTESPHLVGAGLASFSTAYDDVMLLWLQQEPARRAAACAYFARRLRHGGVALLDELLELSPTVEQQATLLRAVGRVDVALDRLPVLGGAVSHAYWRMFAPYGLGHDFDSVRQAAAGLLSVGRFAAALDLLSLYIERAQTDDLARVALAACEGMLTADVPDPEMQVLSSFDLGRILDLLHRFQDDIGTQRIINVEWNLFPALGFEPEAPALHEALSTEPGFFVELVGCVYRSELHDDDGPDEPVDADRIEKARRAWAVLQSWRRPPGGGPDGRIETVELEAWTTSARALLAEHHRSRVGDGEIGRVLAHAAPDPDGTSPPASVRDLLETVGSEHLDRGLELELFNCRGATVRGVYAGGDQERELASTYRAAAARAGAWPRTRRVLRGLAATYEGDAHDFDRTAESRRLGLDE